MKKCLYYAECVAHALRRKGFEKPDFENTDLRVYHRKVASPRTMFLALKKNAIIIPAVRASLFGRDDSQQPVATILLAFDENQEQVKLYSPFDKKVCTCDKEQFVEAWNAAGGECTTAFPPSDTYMPKLIDLQHVELPSEFDELMEAVAENAHDMWALERQSEGWTYGPQRDDQLLQTPDMVPYSQLADSEKEYDRIMAKDTIRLFLALGYKIVKE